MRNWQKTHAPFSVLREGCVYAILAAMSEDAVRDTESTRLYEAAYLVAPTVAEEQTAGVILPLKDLLAGASARVVAEEAPKFRRLAYPIRVKRSGAASQVFDSAFFGWIRFEADAETALAAKKALASIPSIFRFLLIKPSAAALAAPTPVRMFTRRPLTEPAMLEKPVLPEATTPTVSEAELDRRIEELVGN